MADSVGIDRRTGRRIEDWDHVVSSIEDLLTTRWLSRVMLRQYESDFPELIDAPMNDVSLMLFYAAIATSLALWEPRVELTDVSFTQAGADGRAKLQLVCQYLPRGHFGDRTPSGVRTAEFLAFGGAFVALN